MKGMEGLMLPQPSCEHVELGKGQPRGTRGSSQEMHNPVYSHRGGFPEVPPTISLSVPCCKGGWEMQSFGWACCLPE